MLDFNRRRSFVYRSSVVALVLVHLALLAWEASCNSITWDEVGHLSAGLSHWQLGRFDLYRVNPPLVRMAATLPIALMQPRTDWSACPPGTTARMEHQIGKEFIQANGFRSFWYCTVGRWACLPFSLIGAFVCQRWAKELYGKAAGMIALALWCFCPNILAHAQLITPDVGAAALGVLAGYTFWKWLSRPTWQGAFAAAVAMGMAELSKTTWLILFALWPVVWLMRSHPLTRPSSLGSELRPPLTQLLSMLAISIAIINAGYCFERCFVRLGDYHFKSRTLTDGSHANRANRFADGWLAEIHVPLPMNYVLGIDATKAEFEQGAWSFLRGEWRMGGWWYYYLYALAIKIPLGVWLLLSLSAVARAASLIQPQRWREELVLLAPTAAVLWLVSSQTGFNHHIRYVLPALPFVFIWISALGRAFESRHLLMSAAASGALAWSIASCLSVYPYTTTYFNELVGGPLGGPEHLSDSNVDWGQDLLHLKHWIDLHPEASPIGFSYVVPLIDPKIAGIEWHAIPPGPDAKSGLDDWGLSPAAKGPQPGWFAISVNHIYDRKGQYRYFLRFQPVAMAGYSTYIYHITTSEANQVRRGYGLPPLIESDSK
jgi:hypothetical protein